MTIAETRTGVPSASVMQARKHSFLYQRTGEHYVANRRPLGMDPACAYQPNLPDFVPQDGEPIDFVAAAKIVVQTATAEGRVARFLDVGCGENVFPRWSKERFGQAVEAVGISSIDFRNATQREQDRRQGITYLIYDAQTLSDLDQEPFDLIVSVKAIEHMTDPLAVLEGAYKILRPGGFAFFNIPYLTSHFFPPTDYEMFVAFLKENYGIQINYKGIAFQKTRPGELLLPLVYAGLLHRGNCAVATYSFNDPQRLPVQPTRAFEHCG